MTPSRERFYELRDADQAAPADVEALWADLSPIPVEAMLGHWRGGDFATGHPAGTLLEKLHWHGKWFDGLLDVTPIVCRAPDGSLTANTKAAGGGAASLWPIEFNGEVTATMVYDAMPVFDHFKQVDPDTVVGVMNGKLEATFGVADLYWFWLERER